MFRGLLRLTWLETIIFVREPLGVFGSIGVPVIVFVVLARVFGPPAGGGAPVVRRAAEDLPILGSLLIVASALLSLVTIVAIYREGGILRRLRATPLRPQTILAAHVLVKLLSTAVTLALMILAGRRFYPVEGVPLGSYMLALLFTTVTVVSLGFVIASVVPTARFAQPVGAVIVYPMLGLSGLFVPIESLPPVARAVSRVVPFRYAVSLLGGIWQGEGWMAHLGDVAVLLLMFATFTAISARVFRWE